MMKSKKEKLLQYIFISASLKYMGRIVMALHKTVAYYYYLLTQLRCVRDTESSRAMYIKRILPSYLWSEKKKKHSRYWILRMKYFSHENNNVPLLELKKNRSYSREKYNQVFMQTKNHTVVRIVWTKAKSKSIKYIYCVIVWSWINKQTKTAEYKQEKKENRQKYN